MAFLEFYKKGQGTIARLMSLVSLCLLALWGGYSLWVTLEGYSWAASAIVTIPRMNLSVNWALIVSVVVAAGLGFSVVWALNRPRAVDLLVETEAEMKKVSWPSRQEAWNSSLVVVATVMFMMGLLFFYDYFLNLILTLIFFSGGA